MIDELKISYQVTHTEGANPYAVIYDGVTLIASNVVSRYLIYNYGEFICCDLFLKFETYNAMQSGDLSRALTAWNAEYNPLDNYNGVTERVTTDTHGDEVRTHTTGGTDGTHNKVTSEALNNSYTQHDVTTYENQTPRMESKDTTSGGTETTDDLHTEDRTAHDAVTKTVGNTTHSGDIIHTESENKRGNLGVTTSQQMIMSEADMRLNPLIKQYLDRFVYQYAVYVGGAWGGDYV